MILISIIPRRSKMEDENSSGDDQNEGIKNRLARLEITVQDLAAKDEMEWRETRAKEKKYDWPPID